MRKKYLILLLLNSIIFVQCFAFKGYHLALDTSNHKVQKYDQTELISLPATPHLSNKVFFVTEGNKNNWFNDILPILTLLLGIGINKILDLLKDRKRIRKAGERWIAEIRGLQAPIRQQIDVLKDIASKDLENDYEFPELTIISTLNCEIFKSLDKSELLKYIQQVSKKDYATVIQISNQTHGLISILTDLHETLKKKYEDFLMNSSNYISMTNSNLQQLSKAFAEYGVVMEKELSGKDPISDGRYKPIYELFIKFILPHRNDGNYNLFELSRDFLNPLAKVLTNLRHDEKISEMSNYTIACLNSIRGLRMERRYLRDNITIISSRYSEQLNSLTDIPNEIENRR